MCEECSGSGEGQVPLQILMLTIAASCCPCLCDTFSWAEVARTAAAVKAQGCRDDSNLRLALLTLLGCCGIGPLPAAFCILALGSLSFREQPVLTAPWWSGTFDKGLSTPWHRSGSDSKLKDGRFRVAVRKKFFTVRWSMRTDCPKKLWMLHTWKCSRTGWVGLWSTWSSGWLPFPRRGIGTQWSLRYP